MYRFPKVGHLAFASGRYRRKYTRSTVFIFDASERWNSFPYFVGKVIYIIRVFYLAQLESLRVQKFHITVSPFVARNVAGYYRLFH